MADDRTTGTTTTTPASALTASARVPTAAQANRVLVRAASYRADRRGQAVRLAVTSRRR